MPGYTYPSPYTFSCLVILVNSGIAGSALKGSYTSSCPKTLADFGKNVSDLCWQYEQYDDLIHGAATEAVVIDKLCQ